MTITKSQKKILHELANANGVQTSFYDLLGKKRNAPDEALLAIINALHSTDYTFNDLPAALHKFQSELAGRKIEPVIVAWEGMLPILSIHLTPDEALAKAKCCCSCEDGNVLEWEIDCAKWAVLKTTTFKTATYITKAIEIKQKLPFGYHTLTIHFANSHLETFVIAAPQHAPIHSEKDRDLGAFIPIYALHSQRSFGCGDLSDFKDFISWIAQWGGNFAGTLPLNAIFLQELREISPYSPISRLFYS